MNKDRISSPLSFAAIIKDNFQYFLRKTKSLEPSSRESSKESTNVRRSISLPERPTKHFNEESDPLLLRDSTRSKNLGITEPKVDSAKKPEGGVRLVGGTLKSGISVLFDDGDIEEQQNADSGKENMSLISVENIYNAETDGPDDTSSLKEEKINSDLADRVRESLVKAFGNNKCLPILKSSANSDFNTSVVTLESMLDEDADSSNPEPVAGVGASIIRAEDVYNVTVPSEASSTTVSNTYAIARDKSRAAITTAVSDTSISSTVSFQTADPDSRNASFTVVLDPEPNESFVGFFCSRIMYFIRRPFRYIFNIITSIISRVAAVVLNLLPNLNFFVAILKLNF